MSFAVVNFVKEDSVDVVPSNWLRGKNLCLWPPKPCKGTKLTNMVVRADEPGEDWVLHESRVLHRYEHYLDARAALAKAIETSELSEIEDSNKEKGRERRKTSFDDYDVSSGIRHPAPASSLEGHNTLRATKASSQYSSSFSSVAATSSFQNIPAPPTNLLRHASTVTRDAVSAEFSIPHSYSTSDVVAGNHTKQDPLWLVLTKLALFDAQQHQHTLLLQAILNSINSEHSEDKPELPENIRLPVASLDELFDLERQLETSSTAKAVTKYLGCVGGKDIASTTRNVLVKTFTNTVATNLNYMGRGGKTGIHDLNITSVIVGAVRQNRLLSNVTECVVLETVKAWLRFAPERDGGRSRRSSDDGTRTVVIRRKYHKHAMTPNYDNQDLHGSELKRCSKKRRTETSSDEEEDDESDEDQNSLQKLSQQPDHFWQQKTVAQELKRVAKDGNVQLDENEPLAEIFCNSEPLVDNN